MSRIEYESHSLRDQYEAIVEQFDALGYSPGVVHDEARNNLLDYCHVPLAYLARYKKYDGCNIQAALGHQGTHVTHFLMVEPDNQEQLIFSDTLYARNQHDSDYQHERLNRLYTTLDQAVKLDDTRTLLQKFIGQSSIDSFFDGAERTVKQSQYRILKGVFKRWNKMPSESDAASILATEAFRQNNLSELSSILQTYDNAAVDESALRQNNTLQEAHRALRAGTANSVKLPDCFRVVADHVDIQSSYLTHFAYRLLLYLGRLESADLDDLNNNRKKGKERAILLDALALEEYEIALRVLESRDDWSKTTRNYTLTTLRNKDGTGSALAVGL